MPRILLRHLFSPLLIAALFLLDRGTKHLVATRMYYGESIPILPFFHLTYVENTGAAFSMGQERNGLFIIIAAILLTGLLILRRKWEKEEPANLGLKSGMALLIGGAVGNLYDRIAYGSVVDFLDFFVGDHHWPAFNIADSAICVGAFLLAWSQWRSKRAAVAKP